MYVPFQLCTFTLVTFPPLQLIGLLDVFSSARDFDDFKDVYVCTCLCLVYLCVRVCMYVHVFVCMYVHSAGSLMVCIYNMTLVWHLSYACTHVICRHDVVDGSISDSLVSYLNLSLSLYNVIFHCHCHCRYLVTQLMGSDLNNIIKTQSLTDEHVQLLIYQVLRGLKVLTTYLHVCVCVCCVCVCVCVCVCTT